NALNRSWSIAPRPAVRPPSSQTTAPHSPLTRLRNHSGDEAEIGFGGEGGAGESKIPFTFQSRRFPRTLMQTFDAKRLCKNYLPHHLENKEKNEEWAAALRPFSCRACCPIFLSSVWDSRSQVIDLMLAQDIGERNISLAGSRHLPASGGDPMKMLV